MGLIIQKATAVPEDYSEIIVGRVQYQFIAPRKVPFIHFTLRKWATVTSAGSRRLPNSSSFRKP
jgi:hypothetical protein